MSFIAWLSARMGRMVVGWRGQHASAMVPNTDVLPKGHTGGVSSVAFSPDGSRIVSGSDDKTLRLWDAKSGQPIGKPFEGHTGSVSSVAFSPDGKRIVSGGRAEFNFGYSGSGKPNASPGDSLWLWDVQTGQPIRKPLLGHTDGVTSVAFSQDGSRIISSSADKTLRLWDARSGEAIRKPLEGHKEEVMSAALSRDGRRIVSGSNDKTLRLWDARTGKAIGKPLEGHTAGVTGVAFSPDGNLIVSAGGGTLRLWDARTGEAMGNPLDQGGSKVAFSPDGSRMVSRTDKTLLFWDARTGEPIGTPIEDTGGEMAFSPDGKKLVLGRGDGSLQIVEVFGAWAESLCAKLARNPTLDEWSDERARRGIDYICPCPGLPGPPACQVENIAAP